MKCFTCNSSTTKAGYKSNQGETFAVYQCDITGAYAWSCSGCNSSFHLPESFPTIREYVCPNCGNWAIDERHCKD